MSKTKILAVTKFGQKKAIRAIVMATLFFFAPVVLAYEVAVGLGSSADQSMTIAMGDRSKWPVVADQSWGPLANLWPIATLERHQQQAVFDNFKQRQAITELPFSSIRWDSSQPDMDFIQSFGLSIPYVFVLYEYGERVREQGQATADALRNAGVIDSMLTRDEIIRVKNRFPGKKIIMNTRSWARDNAHLKTVEDVVDGVTIEFMPFNSAEYVAFDVAPFAVWAHNNNKELLLLMPPTPEDFLEDGFVKSVTRSARAIYDANVELLPHGWMESEKIIFVPANYSWGKSDLSYVPEDSENSVLAAVKALLMMRPELDAGSVQPASGAGVLPATLLLLSE